MKRVLMSLALVAIFATPVLADPGNLEGSYAELIGPPMGYINETQVVELYVYNASDDAEWISNVIFTWPGCVDVLDGWYDYTGPNGGFLMTFEAVESQARFMDGDGGYGEIYGEDACTFFVEVFLTDVCIPTTQIINYELNGDIWGDPPHDIYGTIEWPVDYAVATDDATWSAVKSMYR